MIKKLKEGVLHYYLEDPKGNEIDFDFEFDNFKAMDFLIDRYGLKELIKFMIHEYYYKHPMPKDTIDALKEEYPQFNSLQDLEFIVDGDYDVDPDLEFIWGTFSDDIDYVLDSHVFDDDLESYFLRDAEEEFNDMMARDRDIYAYYGMSQGDFIESKKLRESRDSLKESIYYDVMKYSSGSQEYVCTFEAENEDDAYNRFLDWMDRNYLDADSGYYIDACYRDDLMDRKVVDLDDFDVTFDEEDEDFEV